VSTTERRFNRKDIAKFVSNLDKKEAGNSLRRFFYLDGLRNGVLKSLRGTLLEGKIDGSRHAGGGCVSLEATLARVHSYPTDMTWEEVERFFSSHGLELNSESLTEELSSRIEIGDTPEDNSCASFVLEVLDKVIAEIKEEDSIRASYARHAYE